MQLRRVYKGGNSLVVSFPEWMLEQIGVARGDTVGLESYPGQWITLQKMVRKEPKPRKEGGQKRQPEVG